MIETSRIRLLLRFWSVLLPTLCVMSRHYVTVCATDVNSTNTEQEARTKLKQSIVESFRMDQKKGPPERQRVRRDYWKRAFGDIRNVVAKDRKRSLSQWKQRLKDASSMSSSSRSTGTRFEGFPSWDRLQQEWSEDVQEYLEKVQGQEESGYSMGNFGRPLDWASEKEGGEKSSQHGRNTAQLTPSADEDSYLGVDGESRVKMPVPVPAKPDEDVLPHTDISDLSKRILIVTTASLPWQTGTAVNPLLRAAYLCEGRSPGIITLMLPWLERPEDQVNVYGKGKTFSTKEDQETWIRSWLRNSANMVKASEDLQIRWYTAWQNPIENSLYSMGDITATIPDDTYDICILEEPEHLNWYRAPGQNWTTKFPHVVGILHTNYFSYALDQPAALIRAPAMKLLVSWMCRAHCHRIIKLSGTLEMAAPEKELVENVHGVRATFLDTGSEVARRIRSRDEDPVFDPKSSPSVYFIGKLLWSKGLSSLMELLKYAEESADLKVKVDMYGGGPDKDAAESKAEQLELDMPFHGPVDHAELAFSHKIFINPSTSEVLCTTSAEALAMGKFAILPSHPSNDFFAQFPNCLTYRNKEEFVGFLYYAMTHSPEPLSEEYSYGLTWEAATKRLAAASCIPVREAELMSEALSADEASIENEKSRKQIATQFRKTRNRFRQFRTMLSTEIEQSRVLPANFSNRFIDELDRRLDVDIDEVLTSPKLRLKLAPAELDKTLLEFYQKVTKGPSGDIMRAIGGGGPVAGQHLYIKRQAAKSKKKGRFVFEPARYETDSNDETDHESLAAQRVRRALRYNEGLSSLSSSSERLPRIRPPSRSSKKDMSMSIGGASAPVSSLHSKAWNGLRSSSGSSRFTILI